MKSKNLGRVVVAAGIGDYSAAEITLIDKCRLSVIDILRGQGYEPIAFDIIEKEFISAPDQIVKRIQTIQADFVFNLFEGFPCRAGSEADFVHMLECSGIKFTGNSSAALRTCLDKYATKKIFTQNGINTPRGTLFRTVADLARIEHVFPAFVKPAFEDASLGICPASFVPNLKSLKKTARKKLSDFSEGLLVEEFISGMEYNVGFFGGKRFELAGVSVLDYEQYPDSISYLNFSSKWEEEAAEYENFMPRIIDSNDPAYRQDVIDISLKAGQLLGCSCYFRVDLREKAGIIYVLDVNPNPDISPDSGFGRQASAKNLSYEDVVIKIVMSQTLNPNIECDNNNF